MRLEFKDKKLEALYYDKSHRGMKGFPPDIIKPLRKAIGKLEAAKDIDGIKALRGLKCREFDFNKPGHHYIKVNDQYRLVIKFESPYVVIIEMGDYH